MHQTDNHLALTVRSKGDDKNIDLFPKLKFTSYNTLIQVTKIFGANLSQEEVSGGMYRRTPSYSLPSRRRPKDALEGNTSKRINRKTYY